MALTDDLVKREVISIMRGVKGMIVRDEQSLEYVVEQLKKSEVFSFDTETADWGFPNTHITELS